jgi:hypothetical protein
MEQPQPIKTVSAIIIVLTILIGAYILFTKYGVPGDLNEEMTENGNQEPMVVEVSDTPMVNGALSAPAGFPQDIPIENNNITESTTTNYPEQNAQQLSLSYQSSQSIESIYTAYMSYLTQSDYEIMEGEADSSVRALFGTRADANLTVAISNTGSQRLVQVSYLVK